MEIVLLLRRDPRGWTAPEVSAQLGTPPESTAMRLFLLASNAIVTFEGSGVPRYRYTPSPDVEPLLQELETIHRDNPEALQQVVGGTGRDPLRSFADAFKLKK